MLEELQRRNFSEAKQHAVTLAPSSVSHGTSVNRPINPLRIISGSAGHRDARTEAGRQHCRPQVAAMRFFFRRVLKRRFRLTPQASYPRYTHQRTPRVLSPDEVARLIDAAGNLQARAILIALYSTGMRRSELACLRVEDIDSERMVIHIRKGKGGKDRDVPICPKLLETLREYWRWKKPVTWPFPGEPRGTSEHLTDKSVWYGSAPRPRMGTPTKKRVSPPYAASQFCHVPAGGWRRSGDDSGVAGTRRPGGHQHLSALVAAASGEDG